MSKLQATLTKTEHKVVHNGYVYLLITTNQGTRVKRTPYKEGVSFYWGHGILNQWCVYDNDIEWTYSWIPVALTSSAYHIAMFASVEDAVEFI